MADNAAIKSDATATQFNVTADELAYSGDTTKLQLIRPVHVTGAEGSKTVVEHLGVAGTPGPAAASVQGVAGGTAVAVSGTVTATGVLTDAQLRATPVAVSGTVTATDVLTDTQLRATPVPVSGTVTATGVLTDTQLRATAVPVSLTSVPALVAGTANIGDVDVLTLPALVAGTANIGDVDVLTLPALVAGTALIGKVGIDQTTPGTTNAVAPQAATSGGCSTYHLVAAASTNVANVKASAGQIYGVHVYNNGAYPVYVKFHNTAGTPTAGAGVVRTVGVQAGTSWSRPLPLGVTFATGIGISIVKGIADTDAVAVAANDCVVDVDFK